MGLRSERKKHRPVVGQVYQPNVQLSYRKSNPVWTDEETGKDVELPTMFLVVSAFEKKSEGALSVSDTTEHHLQIVDLQTGCVIKCYRETWNKIPPWHMMDGAKMIPVIVPVKLA